MITLSICSGVGGVGGGCVKAWPRGPLGRMPARTRYIVAASDDTWPTEMKCPFPGPTATRGCSRFTTVVNLPLI